MFVRCYLGCYRVFVGYAYFVIGYFTRHSVCLRGFPITFRAWGPAAKWKKPKCRAFTMGSFIVRIVVRNLKDYDKEP